MRVQYLLAAAVQFCGVMSLSMSEYDPQEGVGTDFTDFFVGLVTEADNATSTTGYTDYFPSDGVQQTLTLVSIGREAILRQKQYFLPPNGDVVDFDHFPNTTFIYSENATARVYEAQGRIERVFKSTNNCSSVYYKTRYTLLKMDGKMNFLPGAQQVYSYWDYFVEPATSGVSDVPCKA